MSEQFKSLRMNWLDAARLSAACCIIGIHSTTDTNGQAFSEFDTQARIFPVLLRTVSELASTEFFILLSLFLLAFRLEKNQTAYIPAIKDQAKRLLIPFAFWTIFYAFFVLIKANAFGYLEHQLTQLKSFDSWFGYFVLGKSQYHMHFIPTIFFILLFHPLYKLAYKQPIIGLILIPLLMMNQALGSWLWANVTDKMLLDYSVRFIKILSYTGYGFASYAILGLLTKQFNSVILKRILGLALFSLFILFLFKLTYAQNTIQTGIYSHRTGGTYYAHLLIPIAIFLCFFSLQFLNWPEKINQWSKFTFATYLLHPAIIDIIDIALKAINIAPYKLVSMKYLLTIIIAFSLGMIISKIKPLAWTIGLGPLPLSGK